MFGGGMAIHPLWQKLPPLCRSAAVSATDRFRSCQWSVISQKRENASLVDSLQIAASADYSRSCCGAGEQWRGFEQLWLAFF
jgi:hypothetical protein